MELIYVELAKKSSSINDLMGHFANNLQIDKD